MNRKENTIIEQNAQRHTICMFASTKLNNHPHRLQQTNSFSHIDQCVSKQKLDKFLIGTKRRKKTNENRMFPD